MTQSSRQIQTQVQKQVQTLSPQQIMVVKLLELPTLEFEERIHAELLENPALEEGVESSAEDDSLDNNSEEEAEYDSLDDYLTEDDIPDYKLRENNYSKENQAEEIPFSDTTSFYEILLEQLRERELTEKQVAIGKYLIGSLDDDGLIRKTLDSIDDELAIYMGIETSVEEIEQVLRVIQEFDPPGVGSRDLQECLLIQLDRQKEQTPTSQIERRILSDCYEEFTRKHWDKIALKLEVSEDEVKAAIDEIIKLNPRPGASLGESIGKNLQQIIPDFIVESFDGAITVSLNNKNVPELRLSREFTTLVEEHTKNKKNQSKESKDAMFFLKQKMDSAQGFIDAIKQRQNTLMSTMKAIVELQRDFFVYGDESRLKPMILKDVADITGLDISTISRVTNSKYVQTNFGVFSLKHFFGDSFTTEDGEEMSIREVKRILLECIEKEDNKNPYTDEELSNLLKEKGYPIARRTVAKYRQQLNIPVARLRK